MRVLKRLVSAVDLLRRWLQPLCNLVRRPSMPATCSCVEVFFPDAVDIDCPVHGLHAFFRAKLEREGVAS